VNKIRYHFSVSASRQKKRGIITPPNPINNWY
jgi:hypothetical protein